MSEAAVTTEPTGAEPQVTEPTQPAGDMQPDAAGSTPAAGVGVDTPPASEPAAEPAPEDEQKNDWLGTPDDGYNLDGIELPDGQELDDTTAEALAGVCRDMGLSQKSFATIVNKMSPVLEQVQQQAVERFRQDNLKAFAADKELGGAKAKANLETANKAYMKYCPPDLQVLLKKSGLNTHPAMIKMFYGIAQSISDDVTPRGNGGSQGGDPLAAFFNHSKMN